MLAITFGTRLKEYGRCGTSFASWLGHYTKANRINTRNAMSAIQKAFISELISDLKQQRDHLRLKIHLGSVELKEEFEKLDEQLFQLSQRFDPVKDAIGETAEDVWDSMRLFGSEIKDGFVRIGKSLFSDPKT